MHSLQNNVITFWQSLIGPFSSIAQIFHRKKSVSLHETVLWNVLDTGQSVSWNILEIFPHLNFGREQMFIR